MLGFCRWRWFHDFGLFVLFILHFVKDCYFKGGQPEMKTIIVIHISLLSHTSNNQRHVYMYIRVIFDRDPCDVHTQCEESGKKKHYAFQISPFKEGS